MVRFLLSQQISNMRIELTVYNELKREIAVKDKAGNTIGWKEKTIKKFVPARQMFEMSNLYPREYIQDNGIVCKNKTIIVDEDSKMTYLVKGSYEKLKELTKQDRIVVKGFSNG